MGIITETAVRSVILGLAVADAMGVPVEFKTRAFLDKNPVTEMMGHGTYPEPAGSWSDDTSMTLCALDSLSENRYDPDDIMKRFGRWMYNGEYTPSDRMFDCGCACGNAIIRYTKENKDFRHCGGAGEMDNGNGSLMRISPFALYGGCHPVDLRTFIEEGSALTHAHDRSKIACYIYSCILLRLIGCPSADSVYAGIDDAEKCYADNREWKYYKDLKTVEKRERDTIKSTGYVVDTLEAALWCLLTTGSYRECVLKAVNLGEDTDTVAAVAGGLAGALYGYGAIPEEWLSVLIKRDYIETLCGKAAASWS